jgi:hypothetical protein
MIRPRTTVKLKGEEAKEFLENEIDKRFENLEKDVILIKKKLSIT